MNIMWINYSHEFRKLLSMFINLTCSNSISIVHQKITMRIFLTLMISLLVSWSLHSQPGIAPSYGDIVMVSRLDSSRTKHIRQDKLIKVRMVDGRKLEGTWYLEDENTMVVGTQKINMENIYTMAGYVQRNSKEKAVGTGLTILSALGAVYPVYLIIGGFGWGDPRAIFVGATILFFDMMLASAGTNLIGIYPRRFNRMNWDIRVDHEIKNAIPLSIEIPGS